MEIIVWSELEMLSESFALTLYKKAAVTGVVVRACSGYIREL